MNGSMFSRELHDVSEALERKEFSAHELTSALIDRISGVGAKLNAYITITADLAMEQARASDCRRSDGSTRGPLDGIPIAVKDVFDMLGQPTTAGMPLRRHHRAQRDATIITRLQKAGAVIIGKTNLTEGVYAEHLPPYGPPLNPWNEQRWPGASSSGSGVAVAAGLCFGTVGTDTGGSIRLPSSANGITGLKTTWGRVSRDGTFELAATLDHIGPMARSARDAAILLEAIAGPDTRDSTASCCAVGSYLSACTAGVRGLRIGIDERWIIEGVDPNTAAAVFYVAESLATLGAKLVPIRFPDPVQIVQDWFGVCAVQTALAHRETYPARKDEYGQALSDLLDLGNKMTGLDYQDLLLRRLEFSGRVQALFEEVDLIAIPALACTVPTLERMSRVDDHMISDLHRFTCSFTMSGNPTITIPSGVQSDGMPIVTQLVGRHFAEATCFQAAAAFQSFSGHHLRIPAGYE